MPLSLADQLRAIAAQLDSGNPGNSGGNYTPRNEPVPFDMKINPTWNADGTCAADFWMVGRVGCAKGAHNAHYAQASTMMGLSHGNNLLENSIVQPVPKSLPWNNALVSAGDLGWRDGASYNPFPALGSTDRWNAAGCPSKNGHGAYDVRGGIISADAWARVYDGMAAARAK
jgi:hypothetical protein